MSKIEYVDVLSPPRFEPTGEVKPVWEAVAAGDWLGAINLWIVLLGSEPQLLYQQRPEAGWAPGKLDGSVAGYYRAGESGLDGLREAEEELGCQYDRATVRYLGRRLNVGVDHLGRERRAVIGIYMTMDEGGLASFRLDPHEVPAIFACPTRDLIKAFDEDGYSFDVIGIDCEGMPLERCVSAADFSYMWDGYHGKIARIAERFANGDVSVRY